MVADRLCVPAGGLGEREARGRVVAGPFGIVGGLADHGVAVEVAVEVGVRVVDVFPTAGPALGSTPRRLAEMARQVDTATRRTGVGGLEGLARPLVQPHLTVFGASPRTPRCG